MAVVVRAHPDGVTFVGQSPVVCGVVADGAPNDMPAHRLPMTRQTAICLTRAERERAGGNSGTE